MAFIDRVLQAPSYGWKDSKGDLIIPPTKEIFQEAFVRLNFFKTKKNWISGISWFMVLCMVPFFLVFLFKYFSLKLLGVFIVYSMIIMSTHGTIWFHRYCTHKAYTFSHPIFRFITQNSVLRTFPEEIYVVSHHVHHSKSDLPGDPYNAQGGLWYCMLSDVNHQAVARDISEEDYGKVLKFMDHTGVKLNSYSQFQKWGSVASPIHTITLWLGNWSFWYLMFFLIGGHALACCLFGAAMFWFVLVRAFNYNGHGKGEVAHKEGVDFDRSNLSINQTRTGLFSGEWHNNHHLFPGSARAGFLPYQIDLAWVYIWTLHKLGMVSSFRDSKKQFFARYPEALSKRQAKRTSADKLKAATK